MRPSAALFSIALALSCGAMAPTCHAESTAGESAQDQELVRLLQSVNAAVKHYFNAKALAESGGKGFDPRDAWENAATSASFKDFAALEAKVAIARKAFGSTFTKAYSALLAKAKKNYQSLRKAKK